MGAGKNTVKHKCFSNYFMSLVSIQALNWLFCHFYPAL